jgi:alpha-tubulin suppressor-like RCC1 family protein
MSTRRRGRLRGFAVFAALALAALSAQAATAGPLRGWGWNNYGQLDNGFFSDQAQPTPQHLSLGGVLAIGAGQYHSLAARSNGTVWAWGRNSGGQLGDGTTVDRATPVQVAGLTDAAKLAGGWDHSLALRADGTVWAWGSNYGGQLGDGTTVPSLTPRQVPGLAGVVAIAANYAQSFAVAREGTLWAWGDNSYGQLGDGTTTSSSTPLPVLTGVVAVAAGRLHTLAVRSDGSVWAWGANFFGQLGRGTQTQFEATPQPVPGVTGMISVGAGDLHSLAVTASGTVFGWGYDQYGQVGDGTTTEAQPNPQEVVGLAAIVSVAGGLNHSLALGANGRAWGWGSDFHGQLGDGIANFEPQPTATPVQIKGLSALVSGSDHALGLG